MAEGIARPFAKGRVEVFSAGSKPSGQINPSAVAVMKEIGLDIGSQSSKGFGQLPYQDFDYVVTLGCRDQCPFVPAQKTIDWQIDDPKERELEFFRKTRDQITAHVESLLKELLDENKDKFV